MLPFSDRGDASVMQLPASPESLVQDQRLACNVRDLDRLLSRTVMGAVGVDHECITRNFPEDRGTLEMLCIHEVAQGRIQTACLASAAPVILSSRPAGSRRKT